MRWLKAYPTLLKASFAISLEYRIVTAIWILTGVLPLLMMMVWITVAEQTPGGEINGFDRIDFIAYFFGVTLIRRLVGVWIIWDIDEDIRMGKLAYRLLKPLDPGHAYFTAIVGDKPFEIMWVAPPILIAAVLLGVTYPISWFTIPLIILAVFLAIITEFCMQMLIGSMGFWLTQVISFAQIWFFLRAFFSGWVIPIAMFPESMQAVLFYLPFRYLLSFPVELLMGSLSAIEIGQGFLVQVTWLAILYFSYRLLWRRGLSQFTAVGA